MTNLTPELNLVQGEGTDDTADYLTVGLSDSLAIVDGLFNATTGHSHNGAHQGAILGPNAFADNTIPGAKLVDLSVYGAKIAAATITADKLAAGIIEALFAGTSHTTGTNYTVADPIMFVECTAAVTITFPAAANRPITVWATNGQVTLAGGTFIGGSINLVTGIVQNGVIVQGDAITFKKLGANWRAG